MNLTTMKKSILLLLALFAMVACSENLPEKNPQTGGENTEQPGETPGDNTESRFAITLEELHATHAITQVLPDDVTMYYVMYLEEVSYFQSGDIDTPEELWEDDFSAFERSAINANMNLREYMSKANILFQGSQRVQWNNVLPGVKSVLYIYGVQFDEDGATYEAVTDVAWKVIEPETAPLQNITFGLDVAINGAEVTVDITPENFDGYYLVKVVEADSELYPNDDSAFNDDYMKNIAVEWAYAYDNNRDNGHSKQDILENICYTGKQTLAFELASEAHYSVLVYAVDEYDGFVQVVSKPSYFNFVTEQVQQSDMDINIEITNCYVRVADLRVTPSEPDTQYLLMITPTYYLDPDYTNESLVDSALNEFIYFTYTFKGEITSHLNTLYPDTEYIVVAFGYSGGVVTTDVCTKIFKTEAEGECELEISNVVLKGPFRPSDIYNYDPETFKYFTKPYYYDSVQFIVTIEVETSAPTTDIFTYFISKDDYEWLGEDQVFYDLLIDTCEPFSINEGFWDYGAYYLCVAAFDYKGNVTPMWRSELCDWTMDDLRPVEEFIEHFESNVYAPQTLAVRPASKR